LAAYLSAADRAAKAPEIARAQVEQQVGQQQQAAAALLPTLSANASYTRNQYPTEAHIPAETGAAPETITIMAQNQRNAQASVNVPLFDLHSYAHLSASRHGTAAAREGARAVRGQTQLQVAQAYYQVVAAQGILAAADRAVNTARSNESMVKTKVEVGTQNQLSLERARVDTARALQGEAAAQRSLALARRTLATLTGTPETTVPLPEAETPEDAFPAEGELVDEALRERGEVMQAKETLAQAQANVRQAAAAYVPTLAATASIDYSNSTGFLGQDTSWSAGVTAKWNLDFLGTHGSRHTANAASLEAHERLLQTQDQVRDGVHSALLDLNTQRTLLEQTQAEAASAVEALKLAQARFDEGTATALELSQAQSDRFQAEANLSQARANVASAWLAVYQAVHSLIQE
jgi:outer membrane protein TolC